MDALNISLNILEDCYKPYRGSASATASFTCFLHISDGPHAYLDIYDGILSTYAKTWGNIGRLLELWLAGRGTEDESKVIDASTRPACSLTFALLKSSYTPTACTTDLASVARSHTYSIYQETLR
jgi:hypothetical protein